MGRTVCSPQALWPFLALDLASWQAVQLPPAVFVRRSGHSSGSSGTDEALPERPRAQAGQTSMVTRQWVVAWRQNGHEVRIDFRKWMVREFLQRQRKLGARLPCQLIDDRPSLYNPAPALSCSRPLFPYEKCMAGCGDERQIPANDDRTRGEKPVKSPFHVNMASTQGKHGVNMIRWFLEVLEH